LGVTAGGLSVIGVPNALNAEMGILSKNKVIIAHFSSARYRFYSIGLYGVLYTRKIKHKGGSDMDRKVFIDKLATQLTQWDAKIEKLEAKAQKAGTGAKAEYNKQIQNLRDKKKAAQDRLGCFTDGFVQIQVTNTRLLCCKMDNKVLEQNAGDRAADAYR
jgi:hypothetical protein